MKHKLTFTIIRSLFGIYIIWLGIINLNPELSGFKQSYITQSLDKFNFSLNDFKKSQYYNHVPDLIKNLPVDTQSILLSLKNVVEELVYLESFTLILGGILCVFGYSISKGFVLIGLLMDLVLVHNYFYFRDDKMKVNVLRKIALLAGALYIE